MVDSVDPVISLFATKLSYMAIHKPYPWLSLPQFYVKRICPPSKILLKIEGFSALLRHIYKKSFQRIINNMDDIGMFIILCD